MLTKGLLLKPASCVNLP